MSKVELIDYFGDDLMIVNAARVSYGKNKKTLDEKDVGLIKYLIKHKHTSPFRHPQLQFRIECPIFVERQLFKHQVGMSANSISGRYVDFEDSYYKIDKLRLQSKSSKQGSGEDVSYEDNEYLLSVIKNAEEVCKAAYKILCDNNVAKEQARTVLPLSLNTTYMWTGSLAAWLHLWSLRIKPDAQKETRDVAEQILAQVKELPNQPFKNTLEAFGY